MRLKDQAPRLRRLQLKMAGGFVVLLCGGYLLGTRPMEQELSGLNRQITSTQAQLEDSRSRAMKLPVLKDEVRALQQQVARFKSLPARTDLPAAFQEIGSMGSLASVRNYSYGPTTELRNDTVGFSELPFKVSFEGDFESAYGLVNNLETMERLTRLRQLTMRRKSAESDDVLVELKLSLFFAE